MVKARKYVMVKHFQGEPKRSDLKIVEEELPALNDNEVLVQSEYLSVDPYMRPFMDSYNVPADMIGTQVGRITESKHKAYPVGRLVVGALGWRTHTIIAPNAPFTGVGLPVSLLPDLGGLSPSLALGAVGMPGNTAYFGFLDICKPQPDETVVVTGAAGAVGSLVGQMAKIKGCTVIGFAGSSFKCKWLKEELGFDYAFNYKTVNVQNALKEAAPKGVDCYFDNVGGEISSIIMSQMNQEGRVTVCGSISSYNDGIDSLPKASIVQRAINNKELYVQGIMVYNKKYIARWNEGLEQNLKWIKEGKLKLKEHVTDGFDNMFDAFVGLLRGDNIGKAIVKV